MSEESRETPGRSEADRYFSNAVEVAVRIGLVALLALWCFQILRPFIAPVLWGAIIAVTVFPLHQRLSESLGGRPRTSAALLTTAGLLILLVPIGLFAGSLVESAQTLRERIDQETLAVPAPPPDVADWPVIGAPLHEAWSSASSNLGETLQRFGPQLRKVGAWLLAAGAGTGAGIVQFLISLVIAGFFLAGSAGSVSTVGILVQRITGDVGQSYLALASRTIRSVALGILGVAVIQGALLGAGFAAVGLPHAGIWTVLCIGLGVLQLPALIVVLPAVLWAFANETTGVALAFTVWSLLAGLSDTFLKPLLLGRGASVPMLVIFLGAIGGFIWSGFIGLFVGAIVLSLGYELLLVWVSEAGPGRAPQPEAAAPPATPAAAGDGP